MRKPIAKSWLACAVGATLSLSAAPPLLAVQHLAGSPVQQQYSYSPAVISEGGRIVWLAGQTATEDLRGKSIAGDFDSQARTIFQRLDSTLQRVHGSLADLVTMTVFINDPRNVERFVKIRKEFFANGNFPASALLTISSFAAPGMLIEIQGVAVIGAGRVGSKD